MYSYRCKAPKPRRVCILLLLLLLLFFGGMEGKKAHARKDLKNNFSQSSAPGVSSFIRWRFRLDYKFCLHSVIPVSSNQPTDLRLGYIHPGHVKIPDRTHHGDT